MNDHTQGELLEALLDRLLDLPEHQRADFIRNEVLDPELGRELNAMLKVLNTRGLLDKALPIDLVESTNGEAASRPSPFAAGQFIGHYRLLAPLGEGGMASVWLAERDGEFQRQVAVKCLKAGLSSPEIRTRFLQEQQILAKMQHPNIARMYDAGLSAEGVPYIVMEWVQNGVSLLRYCNDKRLDASQRLALFRKICAAVSYAHQNLIVHRDLKPGNILVGTDGEPKLLDFGIAKLLHDQDAEATRTGMRLLTPEYAAPEQHQGGQITTVTDVYALGVTLYELLTGLRPYESHSRRNDSGAPTPPPSAALRRLDKTTGNKTQDPKRLAEQRASTPEHLQRMLRGDLDIIVMKALQEEPERRYASVAALDDDLKRYACQQPIAARKDTWAYRTRKFAHRHAYAVLAATFTIGLLLFAAVFSAYQAQRAQEETRRAQAQQQRAQIEARRAETSATEAKAQAQRAAATKRFLTDLLEVSAKGVPRDQVPSTETILQDGAKRIQEEFNDQPELKLELLLLLGRVHLTLDMTDIAEDLLKQAMNITNRHFSAKDDIWLSAQQRWGDLLIKRSQFAQAIGLLQTSLDKHRQLNGKDSDARAKSYETLGSAHEFLHDYDASIEAYRQARRINAALHGTMHESVARSTRHLAKILADSGHAHEAETIMREQIKIAEKLFGKTHFEYSIALRILHAALTLNGKNEEAEAYARERITILEAIFSQPSAQKGAAYYHLAVSLSQQGKHEEANTWAEKSIAEYEKVDARNAGITNPMLQLARNLRYQRRYEDSLRHARKALALCRAIFGDDHPNTISARGIVSENLYSKKQYRAALEQAQTAMANDTRHDMYSMNVMLNLIDAELALGQAKNAIAHTDEMLAWVGPRLRDSDLYYFFMHTALKKKAEGSIALGRYAEAIVPLSAITLQLHLLPPKGFPVDRMYEAFYLTGYAKYLLREYRGAAIDLAQALDIAPKNDADPELIAKARVYLAKAKGKLR